MEGALGLTRGLPLRGGRNEGPGSRVNLVTRAARIGCKASPQGQAARPFRKDGVTGSGSGGWSHSNVPASDKKSVRGRSITGQGSTSPLKGRGESASSTLKRRRSEVRRDVTFGRSWRKRIAAPTFEGSDSANCLDRLRASKPYARCVRPKPGGDPTSRLSARGTSARERNDRRSRWGAAVGRGKSGNHPTKPPAVRVTPARLARQGQARSGESIKALALPRSSRPAQAGSVEALAMPVNSTLV